MWFDGSLASLSVWITYFLQVILVYLTARSICAFIQDARTRARIWGVFLALTTGMWIFLWIPARAGGPVHLAFRSVRLPPRVALQVALPVEDWWVSHFAKFAPVTAFLYVLLLLAAVLHLVLRSAQLKAVLRETQPPSHQLQLLFRRLCLELNVNRCELGLTSELRSPATCYWWHSHVLLPLELLAKLNGDELDDVLRHELMHVRGHDYLWDRLAALGCRLVFFHPLVWLGYRHLRREREFACDYAVVREQTEARLRYAECLTSLARWLSVTNNRSSGIGFFSSESLLALRVRVLLREPSIGSAPRRAVRVGLVSIVASVAILLVPSLGLSLYSPIHVIGLLTQPGNSRTNSARKKANATKPVHSSIPKEPTVETAWMASQSPSPQSITSLLNIRPASLPLLGSSSADTNNGEASFTRIHDDVTSPNSHAVWDEAPTPLASPPKWRTLVVGAITNGVSMAAGRVDVDDVDGSRKRSH
jgi:beta-lactamase regulating signal transducer with metallopeptidase domain